MVTLGSALVLPFFDKKHTVDEQVQPVESNAEGLVASSGFNTLKEIWDYLLPNVNFTLKARTTNVWYNTTGVSVEYRNVSNSEKKLSIILDLHDGSVFADYQINMTVRIPVENYTFNSVTKTFVINYYDFYMIFNYSDIANAGQLTFWGGVKNNLFYFTIQRLNTPHGHIELDPQFLIVSNIGVPNAYSQQESGHNIARDKNGTLYCVYRKSDVKWNVFLSKSTNNGSTWGSEVELTNNHLYDVTDPSIAIDSLDRIYVTFIYRDNTLAYNPRMNYSHDHGATFAVVPGGISNFGAQLNFAQGTDLAVDSNNLVHIAFCQYNVSAYRRCFYRNYTIGNGAGTWGTYMQVNTQLASKNMGLPSIAVNSTNIPFVCWSNVSNDGSYMKYHTATGWSNQIAICSAASAQYSARMCIDKNNKVHFIWCKDQQQIMYYKNWTAASGFGVLEYVYNGTLTRYPYYSIGVDQRGYVHMVWNCSITTYKDIMYRNLTNSGNMNAAVVILNTTRYKSLPVLMCANYPLNTSNMPLDIPKTGYCFRFVNYTGLTYNINFYKSGDCTFTQIGGGGAAPSASWHNPFNWNMSWGNTSQYHNPFNWNLSFGNTSQYHNPFNWNLSFGNTSKEHPMYNWNISFGNTSNEHPVFNWNISFGNTTGIREAFRWNMSFGNTSNNHFMFDWNMSWGNTSIEHPVFNWNFSFGNTSADFISVTNIYPVNGSLNIPVNVTLHITISHASGYTMNISWYRNNGSIYLGSTNNIHNGTYLMASNASSNFTVYWWCYNVSDGHGNWSNGSQWFRTGDYVIGGVGAAFPLVVSHNSFIYAVPMVIFGFMFSLILIRKKHVKKR
jgi:hypothetical protein